MSGKTTKPRSDLQREASRRNGAKSHGPTSADGLARSSMNALKLGITAKTLVLCNENPQALEDLRQAYYDRFQPFDQAEVDLVDQMVMARWRIRRYVSTETAILDFEILRQQADVDRQFPGITPPMRCSLAFRKLLADDNSLVTISRYEPRLQRAYKLAYETLMQMQANRPDSAVEELKKEEVQNEPENSPQTSPDQPLDAPPQPEPAESPTVTPPSLQNEPENAPQLPPHQPVRFSWDPDSQPCAPSQPPDTVGS